MLLAINKAIALVGPPITWSELPKAEEMIVDTIAVYSPYNNSRTKGIEKAMPLISIEYEIN